MNLLMLKKMFCCVQMIRKFKVLTLIKTDKFRKGSLDVAVYISQYALYLVNCFVAFWGLETVSKVKLLS